MMSFSPVKLTPPLCSNLWAMAGSPAPLRSLFLPRPPAPDMTTQLSSSGAHSYEPNDGCSKDVS